MAEGETLMIYQGDDFAAVVEVLDGVLPADLTGYSVSGQLRRQPADQEATVAATFDTVISGGSISISLPKAVTIGLHARYLWDLQLTDQSNVTTTILSGVAEVISEVTRP